MINLAKLFVQLESIQLLKASKQFGVPASTLRRHRDNAMTPHGKLKLGPRTVLLGTDVEKALYERVLTHGTAHVWLDNSGCQTSRL